MPYRSDITPRLKVVPSYVTSDDDITPRLKVVPS